MVSSSAVPRAGSGSIPDRLSVGALGLALVLLVSVAWATGLFYLAARLGLSAPVRLAWIDGLHVYVGLVGGVFILGKLLRVGLKYRVTGVPNVVPWQRCCCERRGSCRERRYGTPSTGRSAPTTKRPRARRRRLLTGTLAPLRSSRRAAARVWNWSSSHGVQAAGARNPC